MLTSPLPLHPVITVGPFSKWGVDFMTCNPHSSEGHAYIIFVVDYFTKWAEAMPTVAADGKIAAQFILNHIIACFRVPRAIFTDHGTHFRDYVMAELTSRLGL